MVIGTVPSTIEFDAYRFEVWRSRPGPEPKPIISLTHGGTIGITAEALRVLGDPPLVRIYVDRQQRALLLTRAQPGDPGVRAVSRKGDRGDGSVSAKRLLRDFGWEGMAGSRIPARIVDHPRLGALLLADLDEAVPSRQRKRRQ